MALGSALLLTAGGTLTFFGVALLLAAPCAVVHGRQLREEYAALQRRRDTLANKLMRCGDTPKASRRRRQMNQCEIDLICFDCKDCSSPLAVYSGDTEIKCGHCGVTHALSYESGVLCADLVHTVADHSLTLTNLEHATTDTANAFNALADLEAVKEELMWFRKRHSSPEPLDPWSHWTVFVSTATAAVLLVFALSSGFTVIR